jgi:hypothetical protein
MTFSRKPRRSLCLLVRFAGGDIDIVQDAVRIYGNDLRAVVQYLKDRR